MNQEKQTEKKLFLSELKQLPTEKQLELYYMIKGAKLVNQRDKSA